MKPRTGPDRDAALALYRRRAAIYDWELALFEPIRRLAVARLALRPGDVVLDLACGTGLSLPLLMSAVGDAGRVVGIEQSGPMIERARARVAAAGWTGVRLIASPVESARITLRADAALFHFTHDVLRNPKALDKVLSHLKPGARVVASGLKWLPAGLLWPANLLVWAAARHSVTALDGLDAPWQGLQDRIGPMRVEPVFAGAAYVASGVVPHRKA